MANRKGPLSRFRVLDLTRARAGPTAARMLADWGAETIKIEQPETLAEIPLGGARDGSDFQNLHRNKRSITINLKDPKGVEIFLKLAQEADVIIENYRPNVKHRLGIDYNTVYAINPKIVYGSISGFGQTGPYSNRPGLDQIAQGLGGLMSVTGMPGDGPVRVGIPIADLTAGMNLAYGILVALLEREISGEGQYVNTSLLESQIMMMDLQAARYTMDDEIPEQEGNNHPTNTPTGVFQTNDGLINIQASADHLFKRMCDTIGAPEIYENKNYKTNKSRTLNRQNINDAIDVYTIKRSTDFWVEAFAKAGVPCGPIHNMQQVFSDPQVKTLNMSPEIQHPRLGPLKVVGQAAKLARTPQTMHSPTPELGQHTEEILLELGINSEEFEMLKKCSVI
ncbi:CaiB/BaiF CoA-transferase family protein [Alphaproteobacteria bacterium]|nr:CaiB/BaiF CoA-transferase family protein [Alphaproteobacteria bacterium]|tara:strand:- start:1406 stop:2590 length:1185 start_codon:yes stop_codon:yes gene_type:complete